MSGVPNDLSYSLPQISHWAIALLLSHLPQTSHYMGVYVLTVAESKRWCVPSISNPNFL